LFVFVAASRRNPSICGYSIARGLPYVL
jgi:hypothetical protein